MVYLFIRNLVTLILLGHNAVSALASFNTEITLSMSKDYAKNKTKKREEKKRKRNKNNNNKNNNNKKQQHAFY